MKIIPVYLLAAMFVAMFILYIFYPDPVVMIKYPNPNEHLSNMQTDNKQNNMSDNNNVCSGSRYKRN